MARSAFTAPAHVVLQRGPGQFSGTSTVTPDAAVSMEYLGGGLLDHRMPFNKYNSLGNGALAAVVGWANGSYPAVFDQTIANAPATGTGGIAPAAAPTSGTAMTLTTYTSLTNGALVTSAALTTFPFGTVIPTGTVVIQSQMAYLTVGIRDITAAYDPTNACTRVIAVTGNSASCTGGVFIVRGWDIYGQPMSENITATTGITTAAGQKAWKWVKSITPQFSDSGHNYTVDVTNIFGLHLAVDNAHYVDVWNGGTFTTVPSVTVAATAVPSATTGDVRGTVSLTPAGNRTTIWITLEAARIMLNPNGGQASGTAGIFGLANFTQ